MGFPGSSAGKESACNAGDPGSILGSGRSPGEGIRYPTPVFLSFSLSSAGKESACNVGDLDSIPRLGRSPGKGNPLQYSGLENFMDCIICSPWHRKELDMTEWLSLSLLTIRTFVYKVMSLLFNTLSRFVIAFLPRSKHLLISWLQSLSAVILEPKKMISDTVSTFSPSICHEVMGTSLA